MAHLDFDLILEDRFIAGFRNDREAIQLQQAAYRWGRRNGVRVSTRRLEDKPYLIAFVSKDVPEPGSKREDLRAVDELLRTVRGLIAAEDAMRRQAS
jgi:hypothetical protein